MLCLDVMTGVLPLSQGTHATATNEDFATDTEAMVNYLRSRKEINAKKIGIIGHSAGGIIAFIVAKKDHPLHLSFHWQEPA